MQVQNERKMNNNELLEYWFIRIVGSDDECDFEFQTHKPFDDYECEEDNVYIKWSDCDDNLSFMLPQENKSVFCFNLFGFIFY
jgi:hypothetical protein